MSSPIRISDWSNEGVDFIAEKLIGMHIKLYSVELRITETEAYAGPEDSASHARFQKTSRNEPMFGPPARAYIFLCYGIHMMLNVVCRPAGEPAAVLIRSAEIVHGGDMVAKRRQKPLSSQITAGPGKIGQALDLDLNWNHENLLALDGLMLRPGRPAKKIIKGPRVGIDYASPVDRDRLWRFADGDSAALTAKKSLNHEE